jgi:hypothetical protein
MRSTSSRRTDRAAFICGSGFRGQEPLPYGDITIEGGYASPLEHKLHLVETCSWCVAYGTRVIVVKLLH